MFRELWVPFTLVLLFLGSLTAQAPLVGLGGLVFVTGGLARLWSRWSLEGVEYERRLSETRAFVGERVEVTLRLANRKPLPLTWIELQEEFPERLPLRGLQGVQVSSSARPQTTVLTQVTSLFWYERVGWRYHLECRERGYYQIGPARLRSSDLFGIFPRQRREQRVDYLLVYPRVLPLSQLGLPAKRPFGDVRSQERIFEDPSRVMGLREYQAADPLKRIDWKATARRQALQVKVFEPTITQHVVVVVNIATFERPWQGYDPVVLERAVTVAASVASYACEARWSVGLLANGSFAQSDLPLKISPGRDPYQLLQILEALAMVVPMTTISIEDLLQEEGHRLPWGCTLAVVTGLITESFLAALAPLRAAGHRVVILSVASEPGAAEVAGISVYHVGQFLPEAV